MNRACFLTISLIGFTSFACASSIAAATITLLLDQSTPGEFQLFARANTGDNFGISRYNIPLEGPITSVDHESPQTFASSSAGNGPVGFTSLRSADGNTTLRAAQDTTAATPLLIRGFGQEDSSFAEKGFTPLIPAEQPDWGVPLLIARGTATGSVRIDTTNIDLGAGVLLEPSGIMTGPADLEIVIIPEPTTAILIGLGYAGLGIASRRWLPRRSIDQREMG